MPSEPEKLRIAYVVPALRVRGETVYAGYLASRMSARGHAVLVICPDVRICPVSLGENVTLRHVSGLDRMGTAFFAARRAASFTREFAPDLIHGIGLRALPAVRALSRTLRCSAVLTATDFCTGRTSHTLAGQRVAAVIALSEAIRENLVNVGGVAKERIQLIRGGVEVRKDAPGVPTASGDVRVVGTVGDLDRSKGIEFFVRAARKVVDAGYGAQFLILGSGPDERRLRRLRRELDLLERLVMAPLPTGYSGIFSAIDIFVLPSVRQAFGFTMLEAMARGKAVIASGTGGVYDVLREGETGLVVRPGDADQLASRIMELLDDPGRASALGGAAARDVSDRFNLTDMIERTEALYSACVCGAPLVSATPLPPGV